MKKDNFGQIVVSCQKKEDNTDLKKMKCTHTRRKYSLTDFQKCQN